MADYGYGKGPMGAPTASKRALGEDAQRMKRGELGLSDAQKRSAMNQSLQQAGQQAAAQQRNINRQAMAASGPGGQFSGQAAALTRDLGKQAADTGAAVSASTEQLSAQLAERQAADIRARLERQQDRARENAQAAYDNVIKGITTAVDVGSAFMPTGAIGNAIGKALGNTQKSEAGRSSTGTGPVQTDLTNPVATAAPAAPGTGAPGYGGMPNPMYVAQQPINAVGGAMANAAGMPYVNPYGG